MTWPAHPDDVWIEVTCMGGEPEFIRGTSGAERVIGEARAKYLDDAITIEEFEAIVHSVAFPNGQLPE